MMDLVKYMQVIHTMEPPVMTEEGVVITFQNGSAFAAPEVFQGLRRPDGTWVQISDPKPAISSNGCAIARATGIGDSIRILVARKQ